MKCHKFLTCLFYKIFMIIPPFSLNTRTIYRFSLLNTTSSLNRNTRAGKYGFKDYILLRFPGVLKAIHCGQQVTCNRITKDTIIFNASDFPVLVEKLQLDLHEPPMSQVSKNPL